MAGLMKRSCVRPARNAADMDATDKQFLGALAVALTFIGFWPYIRSIRSGSTRPHVFSWVIWALTTFIVFLAQMADDGGAGAWSIGVSGVVTAYVAVLAYFARGDTHVTRSDWVFFVLALSSLPVWYIVNDPLWAVVILTMVDLLGFGPTYRKAYQHPYEEQLTFYVLFAVRNAISIAALENYSLTTLAFPVLTAIACVLFVALVWQRRRVVPRAPSADRASPN
jgi:hypothetical protein